jgi:hypothetical protein
MTEDHELVVFSEEALRGRVRNTQAWAGYAAAYPDYVIYPRAVAEPRDGCVSPRLTRSGLRAGDHEPSRKSRRRSAAKRMSSNVTVQPSPVGDWASKPILTLAGASLTRK